MEQELEEASVKQVRETVPGGRGRVRADVGATSSRELEQRLPFQDRSPGSSLFYIFLVHSSLLPAHPCHVALLQAH